MGFFAAIVVSLILAVVGELLRPKQKPQNAKPSSLDDFSIPTAEEGRSVPIFAGKVKIDGGNVAWYGDLSVTPIKKKIKTGWFSSATQILGFKYRLGMQMVLSHGREDLKIHEIRFGDSMPAHTRTVEANGCTRFNFNDENFYGGPEKEGGISGVLRFYHGVDAQTANAYLAAKVGEPVPAYKNICHAILENLYLGTSSYIKPIGFIVSSYPNQLGLTGNKHKIGPLDDEDCNPACFIYEVMTDKVWGVGINPIDIDLAKFQEIGNKLFDEGYGMSMIYNGGSSAKDLIAEILRHIDGVVFSDPQTGLVTIRLARGDYVLATLPVYGKDDFVDGIKFSRPSWSETRNTLKATYIDRNANYTEAVVSQQELSNIQQRGGEISMDEIDFRGFTKYAPAALATARALKTMSYPLGKATGQLTRKAWKTKPADVFVLYWPERGLINVVMRVISVNYGNLNRNAIDIEAVEDIFAISEIAYTEPPPSGWIDPVSNPLPLSAEALVEAPGFGSPNPATRYAITLGAPAGPADVAYDVWSDPLGGTAFAKTNSVLTFTPTGLLLAAYNASGAEVDEVGFTIGSMKGVDLIEAGDAASRQNGENFVIIGNEWIAWRDFVDNGDSTYTVKGNFRGSLDTIAEDHAIGARVWFVSEGAGVVSENGYTTDITLKAKFLTRSIRKALLIASAATLTLVTNNRALRPLPPGKLRVNTVRPDPAVAVSSPFDVTWVNRNRLDTTVYSQADASRTPEVNQYYNLRFRRADTNALLVEKLNINGLSATVKLAYAGNVYLELESVRDTLLSWQKHRQLLNHPVADAVSQITADEIRYVLDGGGA